MMRWTCDFGDCRLETCVSEDFHCALVEDVGAGSVGCSFVAGEEDGFDAQLS